ncbi:MAG: nuclear transport factor 2 family protein [Burkholderiaceae bacterium]|nr:nuclear transport factor 2 family protein [Burkholderiaceae bacterium]
MLHHQLVNALLGLCCLTMALDGARAAEPGPYVRQSEQTRQVAEPYFKAYLNRDWDTVAGLLAEQASFGDPTATLVFGGVQHQGRQAVLKLFRESYAAIVQMRFQARHSFHSGHYAVFSGDLDWTLRMQDGREVRSVMPFVTSLRIEDGKVIQHQDLADYAPFLSAVRAPRP